MDRRRVIAISFFSIVIVAALIGLLLVASKNASQTLNVWRVKDNVNAGAAFDKPVVEETQLRGAQSDFTFTSKSPDGSLQFADSLKKGDIVRDDDLIPLNQNVPLTLTISGTPAVAPGDLIDVYLWMGCASGTTPDASCPALIPPQRAAHAIRVQSVAPGSLTVLVPVLLSSGWMHIPPNTTSKLQVFVVKTIAGPVPVLQYTDISSLAAFLGSDSTTQQGSGSPSAQPVPTSTSTP